MFRSRMIGLLMAGLMVLAISIMVVSSAQAWELLVSNGAGAGVQRFSDTGADLGVFTSGVIMQVPADIGFGRYGDFFVVDIVAGKLVRFDDTTGAYIDTVASGLKDAIGFAADPNNGDVYVTHRDEAGGTDLGMVTRYAVGAPGVVVAQDIFPWPGNNYMLAPYGIAFGPDGNMYIAAQDGEIPANGNVPSIYVYTRDGTFIKKVGLGNYTPRFFAFNDDYIYWCEYWGGKVWRVKLNELGITTPQSFLTGYADTMWLNGIEFGPDGKLYVSNQSNKRVLRFNGTTGAFEDEFIYMDPNQASCLAFKGLGFAEPPEPVTSIDDARKTTSGRDVEITGAVVSMQMRTSSESGTPAQPSSFAIQDGPSGIRVISALEVTPGDRVTVVGRTATINGERVIDTAYGGATKLSSGTRPAPVFMSNKVTGGGVYGGQPAVADDASQVPPKMAAGYNTTGIYVKIFGKVTDVVDLSDTTGYFYVDDGSGLKDGTIGQWTGEPRIGMRCGTACSTGWPVLPNLNSYVVVTGVVGVQNVEGVNVRYLWTDSFTVVNVQP